MKNYILIILFLCGIHPALGKEKVLRIGVAGLNHGHVGWVFEANKRPDIEIVGIAEPNRALAERYVLAHGLSMDCTWIAHGVPLDCPLIANGLPMDCPWIALSF